MNHDKYKDKYRERLKKILGKKFDTTMIFPLSQFEMAFGYLWGHGKPESELTTEEKVNLNKWHQVRNSILNCGNQQKRNCNSELDQYEVIWQRYQTLFIPKDLLQE
jgi:hypothetical protein